VTLTNPADRLTIRRELQELIRRIETRPRPPRPAVADTDAPVSPGSRVAWRESPEGRIGYREFRYGADAVVGTQSLAPLFAVDAPSLNLISRGNQEVASPTVTASDLVFFDIETTGLSGAGAMLFLFAAGRVEADEFVVRQYVAPSPADEAALIDALIEMLRLDTAPVLVTYNGLSFDAPFADERATLHRRRAGLQSMRHLDLLHTVRRGYRGVLPSHRLGTVEAQLLGVTRPALEVGGAEVPAWYFRYVRTGSARFLAPLLDHNAVDVLSLAALIAHLHEGLVGTSVDARRSLALGRLALAAREPATAEPHLRSAVAGLQRPLAREEAIRALAIACRSQGARERVVAELHELSSYPGAYAGWAREQLAIYYEHQARDPRQALAVTVGLTGDEWDRRRERLARKVAGLDS